MSHRNVAIIGDGKMGQSIRQLAVERGWRITAVVGERESADGVGVSRLSLGEPDVAVEFTQPSAAVANVLAWLREKVPVVVGTTGWDDSLPGVTPIPRGTGTAPLLFPHLS